MAVHVHLPALANANLPTGEYRKRAVDLRCHVRPVRSRFPDRHNHFFDTNLTILTR